MDKTVSQHISQMKLSQRTDAPLTSEARKQNLTKLRNAIEVNQREISAALAEDLGKSAFEAFSTEISFVQEEITIALQNLDEWMEETPVSASMAVFPATASIHKKPKGLVLIISPWNYPFQLLLAPLVSALAAGNRCVLKPSELSVNTTNVILKMLNETLPSDLVYCVTGDAAVSTELLKLDWDHVFFTGSTHVGRIIARACAEKLTPCTLELGGKSPAIVDSDVNLKSTARKIVWGKFLNAGQTCIGVDYLLVHEKVKEELIKHLRFWIHDFYGSDPIKSPDFGRIISFTHYDRLTSLITSGSQIHGGRRDRVQRYIEPTLIDGASLDHPAMKEEIFGPILPIISWQNEAEVYSAIEANPNPLALYLFTKNKDFENRVINTVPFGGGCINHTLLHFACHELPFGGVRQSGLGAYHGKFGFDLFTNQKGILRAGRIDVPLKYPKYNSLKLKTVKLLMG
jgi:acyl-CoA reductase-like NAD-dependent aldehyde dehydrogenase